MTQTNKAAQVQSKKPESILHTDMLVPAVDLHCTTLFIGRDDVAKGTPIVNDWLEDHTDITIIGWLQSECAYGVSITLFYRYIDAGDDNDRLPQSPRPE